MDILEQIQRAQYGGGNYPMHQSDVLDSAAEEIQMLRDRLKNLRQKLAELGADTDCI